MELRVPKLFKLTHARLLVSSEHIIMSEPFHFCKDLWKIKYFLSTFPNLLFLLE